MTNQTRSVSWKNTWIGQEFGTHGRLLDNTTLTRERDRARIRVRPKSDETRAEEARILRYERRSNTCGECHMVRSLGTGECGC